MFGNYRLILIISFLTYSLVHINAQNWRINRYEGTLGIGTTNFFGDIGGTRDFNNAAGFKDIQLKFTRPAFGLGARYKLVDDMALKMNLFLAFIAGNDDNARNEKRNFAFTSTIFESSFQFEYYIISEQNKISSALFNRRGMINNFSKVNAYLFAGFGTVLYYPKPKENFKLYFEDNFSKLGLVFPVGFGLKYPIDSNWSLGFELGRRFTLTDYIDGYDGHLKGYVSEHKDTYYFSVLNAVYKIRANRKGLPMLRKRGFHR